MPITYVRLVYTKPGPDVFQETFNDLEDESILFIDPVLEATSQNIGDLYRDPLARIMRMRDIIVFRGSGDDFTAKIARDPVVGPFLRGRRGGALVSASSALGDPSWQTIPGVAPPTKVPDIGSLRQAELVGILKRTKAIFESRDYHFALPYVERHAEKFIRLGDALRSIYDVDRVTDWLLSQIRGDTVVIGDTGSMLPLMLRLREQVRATGRHNVEIATLDRYPLNRVDLAATIDAIKNRPMVVNAKLAGTEPNYLFLISVSSSGRLCGLFRKLAPAGSRIVVICRTSDEELPCELSLATVKIQNWRAGADGRCEKCNTQPKIYVNPESYELLPQIEWVPVSVSVPRARVKAEFWTMVDRQQAVRLHVDVPYSAGGTMLVRHFSVLLDTRKLAEDERFSARCVERMKSKLKPPDLILIPQHANSDVVEALCRAAFPGCRAHTVPAGRLQDDLREPLRQSKQILIADDAIVTGGTLFNYRSAIYRITQDLEARPQLSVFVMVSRPADRIPLESLGRRYRDSEGVSIVSGEEIFLPDEQYCPWCREEEFLRTIQDLIPAVATEVLESINARIEKLLERPLAFPFFMHAPGDIARKDPRAIDSFFGADLAPHAAFAAGVCVAQTMKMELGNSARPGRRGAAAGTTSAQAQIVPNSWNGRLQLACRALRGLPLGSNVEGVEYRYADMSMVYDAYFETTLMGALLRTFDGVHVRLTGIDDIFERKFRLVDPIHAYPGAVTELAYAALEGKVPSTTIRLTLDRFKDRDSWFRMLLAIMDTVNLR